MACACRWRRSATSGTRRCVRRCASLVYYNSQLWPGRPRLPLSRFSTTMTLRKITHMAERSTVQRGILTALALASLAGCGSINSSFGTLLEPSRIDYKSAATAPNKTRSLEVPPDLTQLQRDSRYALPDTTNRGTATASGFNAQTAAAPAAAASMATPVAAKVTDEARVERDGSQRWLVVKMAPEVLWPQVK